MELEKVCAIGEDNSVVLASVVAGKYVLTAGADKSVKLYNPERQEGSSAFLVHTFDGPHGYGLSDLSVTKDHAKFACCGTEGRDAYVWDVTGGIMTRKLTGHHEGVTSVCIEDTGKLALTGSKDRTVRIYDIRTRSDCIQVLEGFLDDVSGILVSSDSILTSSVDGKLRSFDIRKSSVVVDDIGPSISSIALSSDGACVLAACVKPGILGLVDLDQGVIVQSYKGHVNEDTRIQCCFLGMGGEEYVAMGSETGDLHFWSILKAEQVHQRTTSHTSISALACSLHTGRVVSFGYNGGGAVWQQKLSTT
mmetsp:Transcript_21295/g.39631  ORF Transcript_21295/g.39631 Transcript_21295/m.39631 type:complete len:307 (+) Transcript_21295:217-1137(+)